MIYTKALFLSCVVCGADVYCEQLQRLYSLDWGEVTCKRCNTTQQWEIRIEVKS